MLLVWVVDRCDDECDCDFTEGINDEDGAEDAGEPEGPPPTVGSGRKRDEAEGDVAAAAIGNGKEEPAPV